MGFLFLTLTAMSFQGPMLKNPDAITWQEEPLFQKVPGYHPVLRFFPDGQFVFLTPDKVVVDGHFTRDGLNAAFQPEHVFELNHADLDHLVADEDPGKRKDDVARYERNLKGFEVTYSQDSQTLKIGYGIAGFELHPFDYGDANLKSIVGASDAGFVGVWSNPNPVPERLDAKMLFREFGLDGLRKYAKEALACDESYLIQLDLRCDYTARLGGGTMATWSFTGGRIHVLIMGTEIIYDVDPRTGALMKGGQKAWVRR